MEALYFDIINVGRLIDPMTDREFWEFINTDKYGNRGTDLAGLLNLLDIIISRKGYESKEALIYKLLINENSTNTK